MMVVYHFLNLMNVSSLSLCGQMLLFFLNIDFTLSSSMVEIVFLIIHSFLLFFFLFFFFFEFYKLFYKYNSSLGMVALFPSAFIHP